MSAYITELKAAAERDRAQRAEQKDAELKAAAERLMPLVERLARVLDGIPKEVQAQGLAIAELQVRLRGRSRRIAHVGELGDALRRLGYVRKRSWSGDKGFRALWFPRPQEVPRA